MTSKPDGNKAYAPSVVVLMGVSGSGKSTIGTLLAETLGWQYADSDSFHPPANVDKMSLGIPLDDVDRLPWLESLRSEIRKWLAEHKRGVMACSALKGNYRHILNVDSEQVRFVYLKGDHALFAARLAQRKGHFMKASMLDSQLDTLEEPRDALSVDASMAPPAIVDEIIKSLKLS